jgi:hypothetical protein
MYENNTLNILNGQAMQDYFKKNKLDKNGIYEPFNEAMCVGQVTTDIFSNEFKKYRCEAHKVTIEQYHDLVIIPLQQLFKNEFSQLVLWFDDDMFCQINLLTLLAYMDQINYRKKVTFNLVDRVFQVVDHFELEVQGYYEIYKQVMIKRCIPGDINLTLMKNGVKFYLEYLKEENEITKYIKEHAEVQREVLVIQLLETFLQYGLGDTQYIQLIDRCREGRS